MMTRHRAVLIALVVVALGGLLTIATWASMSMVTRSGHGPDMMGGSGYGPRSDSGMMPGHGMAGNGSGGMGGYVLPGNGPVDSLDAARQRAQVFADRWNLRAGEVMEFDNGFYAELRTADGQRATEVLIDSASGGVRLEYGPAMMWNTSYGMHPGQAATPVRVSPAEAARIAQRWLDDRRQGLSAHEPELFPGYYTLHTTRDGKISGMMSVNAYTGAVWYHTWHGRYVAMSEG
jgi:hypothetical protein